MTVEDKYNIKVLEKTLNILKCFTSQKPEWTVNELCKEVKMSRNNVYRILVTLCSHGFMAVSEKKDTYRLGTPFVVLGSTVLNGIDLRKIASFHLKNLRDTSGETVYLAICHDNKAVIIDNYESSRDVRASLNIGTPLKLHAAASGKIFLADLSNQELEEYINSGLPRYTKYTHTSYNEINDIVSRIRNEKLALDLREYWEDSSGAAAPVFNHENRIVASVGAVGPCGRFEENLDIISADVKKAAYNISKEMGYHGSF